MSHQYRRVFDPDGEDSLAKLARLIPPGSRVLDVGAGPGVLADYLSGARACWVDGIEYDGVSAEEGRGAFRSLWVADLERERPADLVDGARYDAIVCADILEHLVDPAEVLKGLVPLLQPWGRLLLSVPNVAHAGLIAELIGGELRYRPEGLLDRTHLRFFTRASLLRMLAECGLAVRSIETVEVPVGASEFSPAALAALDAATRERLLGAPDALTYQFICACVPHGCAPAGPPLPAQWQRGSLGPVEVIVPVYAGFAETRACIESVLAAPVRADFALVAVDDCGPEPELRAWLKDLAAAGRIELIENPRNLGYVASVNRALERRPERDAVLLNSDTEVANDWLDRLRAAAYGAADIGTVTPFANRGATICAYPLFCADNPLPEGWDVAALDGLMRAVNAGAGVDLPTSVGFCTYLRRDCLRAVGLFDAETFGRGYGEENDFSMRAHSLGWRHRLAADVFVAHRGGVSFGAEKAALCAAATRLMRARHPTYEPLIERHFREDPARPLRERVGWQRLARSPRPRLLVLTHALGGGVERHVRDLARWLEPRAETLVLRPEGHTAVALEWLRSGESGRLVFDRAQDLPRLVAVLKSLSVERVHVHHVYGYAATAREVLGALGLPYDITVHDYLALCPRIHLVDCDGRFCDQPDAPACNRCLAGEPQTGARDIAAWRAEQGAWLAGAERVLVPSRDTGRRLRRVWPDLALSVAPHDGLSPSAPPPAPRPRRWHSDSPLRVVVLGTLSTIKGLDRLAAAARDAARRALPLELHLVGQPLGPLPGPAEAPLFVHGAYAEEELAGRLARLAPHLAWFPGLAPETWSYTLDACLAAGLPVAAPRLGAFTERLAGWAWSCPLPAEANAEELNDRLLDFAASHLATLTAPAPQAPGPTEPERLPDFDYAREYLRPLGSGPRSAPDRIALDLLVEPTPPARPYELVGTARRSLDEALVPLESEIAGLRRTLAEREAELARAGEAVLQGREALAAAQAERAALAQALGELQARAEALAGQRDSAAAELRAAVGRAEALAGELAIVYGSRSWALTRPVRGLGRALRAGGAGLLAACTPVWHRLPMTPALRLRLKTWVFRRAAPLLRGSAVYRAWLEQIGEVGAGSEGGPGHS